jgi:ribosomal protein S18 acetylase RimI-like enzyme
MDSTDLTIRPFRPDDEPAVIGLWCECGLVVPWNDPHLDIQRKRAVQPELFLVGCIGDKIVASVMAGYDGHRGWINYLAVKPGSRRKGIATALMAETEKHLIARGCPKINLQVRSQNTEVIEFYKSIGFSVDDVESLGKRLIIDEPD